MIHLQIERRQEDVSSISTPARKMSDPCSIFQAEVIVKGEVVAWLEQNVTATTRINILFDSQV